LDRGAGEAPPKGSVVECRELSERRRGERGPRRKGRVARFLGELVPGAGSQAVVAAVDAVAEQRAQLRVDRSLMFDGEIGDAAAGIDAVGRGKGLGRAGIEAGAALATMVGLGPVVRQLSGKQEFAEEQPGAELARDEVGVLALPAQSCRLRCGLLHHRRGVDEYLYMVAVIVPDEPAQRL